MLKKNIIDLLCNDIYVLNVYISYHVSIHNRSVCNDIEIYIYIIYLSLHNRSVCNDIEKSPRYVKCKSKVLHNIFYPYLGKLYNIMGLLWEFLFLY